jgi:putative ABC transport system permease protein
LIVIEGMIVGLIGGMVGTLAAVMVVRWGHFSVSTDGMNVPVIASASVVVVALMLSALLGVGAGLVPAWQASRREMTQAFRAV